MHACEGRRTVKVLNVFQMQLLLSVELGETSPRQRTILRREMLSKGWRLVGTPLIFSVRLHDLETDEQAIASVTDQLHGALNLAEIDDWGADCFIQTRTPQSANNRLTRS